MASWNLNNITKDIMGSNITNLLVSDGWIQLIKDIYTDKATHTVLPSTWYEEIWMYLLKSFGEFGLELATYAFMIVLYILFSLICFGIDYFRMFPKYKIQPGKYMDWAGYKICIKGLLFNYIFVIVPMLFIGFPVFTFFGFRSTLPLPSWKEFSLQMVFFLYSEDFWHYWFHRALHTPFLYKHVHKVHHLYQAPFGLAAAYAHPVEVLLEGIAAFLGPIMVAPHFVTFYTWIIWRQLEAVVTHCGYEIPSPLYLMPSYGGAWAHDFHHKAFTCNYGSRFMYLDKIFGTWKQPPPLSKSD